MEESGEQRGQGTVCDLLDKQIGLQAKWIKRLSWVKKTRVTGVATRSHLFCLEGGGIWKHHVELYFPMRVCVCVCVLCKSIFVCFATSLDILFGATDRKAVKYDLNILCLHRFPPFSLLSLPFDFSPSLPSAVNSIIGSKRVPVLLTAPPLPTQRDYLLIAAATTVLFVHTIKP